MNEKVNEVITAGGANGEIRLVTGTMDVDGSEMKVSDIPVNLPDKVVVIDQKLGREIGFVDKADVMRLLNEDARYEGFEDEATGQFMLTYNGDRAKAIESQAADLMEWIRVVESNLDTAMGADDPKNSSLGVSYAKGKYNYVCYLHISKTIGIVKYLRQEIVDALKGGASEDGPSQRVIDVIKSIDKNITTKATA